MKVAAAPPVEAPGGDKPAADKAAAEEQPAPDEKPSKPEASAKARRPQFPVVIKTDPDGTRVSAGKRVLGTTPLTLKLRPGSSYDLMFTKPGYTPLSRKYRFDSEEPQTLRVTLKKSAPEPHKAAPPAPAAPPPPPPKKGFFAR